MVDRSRLILALLFCALTFVGCSGEKPVADSETEVKTFPIGDPMAPGPSSGGGGNTSYPPANQTPLIDPNTGFIRGPVIDGGALPVLEDPVLPEPATAAPVEAVPAQ